MSTNHDAVLDIAAFLFGGGVDETELISKMEPAGPELSTHAKQKKRERTQARIGLASNIVGGVAGVAATGTAYRDLKQAQAEAKGIKLVPKTGKLATKVGHLKTRYPLAIAGGALALQAGNNVGDAVANRVLARESKKKISKGALSAIPNKRDIIVAGAEKVAPLAQDGYRYGKGRLKKRPKEKIKKNEVIWEGEFSKINDDKQQVFGWASVVEINGEPVVDLQGDYIDIDEVEKSAYEYVIKSRQGGDMHRRAGREGEIPLHVSDMIESFVVTPEKIEKMGLPDTTPVGWWVGYKINDPLVWGEVKSGKRTGFSIHGRGKRS